jgi:hypothetical protein
MQMYMVKLQAVSPKKGLSCSKANDDRKDKTKLECPETSRGKF